MKYKLRQLTVVFAYGNECHTFRDSAGQLSVQPVRELHCDHQEADTRMLLHA